jgi:RNA polymerase sigma factor for flagellar operon FliA
VDARELVETHLELVRKAAGMIHKRVGQYVELEELVSLGNEGLTEAAQRYDASRGATFSTFAWYRVQGAMIDGLRRTTNLPRRVWAKLTALRAAGEYLEHRSERDAGAAKTGAPPPDSLARIKDAMSAIRTMYTLSLDGLVEAGAEFDSGVPAVEEHVETHRVRSKIAQALATLPDKERALMTKHYYEGKNLVEASSELGISKSWASRLHAQAVERLRAMLEDEVGSTG